MKSQAGFTLIELMIVMAITAVVFGIVGINVYQPQGKASLDTTVTTLLSQMREQQLKSMLGDSEETTTAQTYGVHFETNTFTLFRGSYAAGASSNYVVDLGQNISFASDTFSSTQIVFNRISGEVSGFSSNANSVVIKNTVSGEKKTLTINRYGVPSIQ
jgi:prepilin-type N-terminal cleavage/methylation domain-containing protein